MDEKKSRWIARLKKLFSWGSLYFLVGFYLIIQTDELFASGKELKAIVLLLQLILILVANISFNLDCLQRQSPRKEPHKR